MAVGDSVTNVFWIQHKRLRLLNQLTLDVVRRV